MAGQRTNLASLAAAKVEDVPGRGSATLSKLPLTALAPTPVNPRTNFGSADELAELGASMKRRQLQPIVVVTRALYLKQFPEHTAQVGADNASYVIAVGERRYRAALAVELGAIEAVVRDEVAATRREFVDAVLAENLDRKNFDPIEEAHAIDLLVKEFKTAREAATHKGKTEAWVSQRRSLLRLAPPVQELVRNRAMPVETARALAKIVKDDNLDASQQLAWWDAEQQAAKQARSAGVRRKLPSAKRSAPRDDEETQKFTAVKSQQPAASVPSAGAGSTGRSLDDFTAVNSDSSPTPSGSHTAQTLVPHQGGTEVAAPQTTQGTNLGQLAKQPKELAAAIAAELTSEDLLVLIEELHTFV